MPVCGADPTHELGEWWRRNELGRWYECQDCGSTVLAPSLKYKTIVLGMRSRRLVRSGVSKLGLGKQQHAS